MTTTAESLVLQPPSSSLSFSFDWWSTGVNEERAEQINDLFRNKGLAECLVLLNQVVSLFIHASHDAHDDHVTATTNMFGEITSKMGKKRFAITTIDETSLQIWFDLPHSFSRSRLQGKSHDSGLMFGVTGNRGDLIVLVKKLMPHHQMCHFTEERGVIAYFNTRG